MALPKSVCDNCVNTKCLWRAPTGGNDPPVMICPNKINKPQTNYDRIISKTPEELAEWIAGDVLNLTGGSLEMATEAWLDWLKREATNGT